MSATNGNESIAEQQPDAVLPVGGPEREAPLRSRAGGVNRPRAVVPTPILAAEAQRLLHAASIKRARKVTAFGLPAVVLAASGVAVLPTVANAAQGPASNTCPSGSRVVNNPAGVKGAAPSTKPTSAPSTSSSVPLAAPTSKAAKPGVVGAPSSGPTSGPTTPPATGTTAKPPTSTAPPVNPTPTAPTPTGTATSKPSAPGTSSTPSKPAAPTTTTPSTTSTVPWWDPLGLLGTTVNQVFNPNGTTGGTANQLSTTGSNGVKLAGDTPTTPSSSPSSSPSPILGITVGGPTTTPSSTPSTSPSSAPSSAPSSTPTSPPSTPQPTGSSTAPSSAPSSPPSSSPTAPSSSSSTPLVIDGTTVPPPPSTVCVQAAGDQAYREAAWHLDASSLTLTNQTFEGFHDIVTGDDEKVTVMVIHADAVDLTDMVTYNLAGQPPRVYSNGGRGKNVHLTNVTLHVLRQKGIIEPLFGIPLGEVTLGPPGEAGTDPLSQLIMTLLQLNLPLPPTTFKDVHVDQYLLTSDTLAVPGFNIKAQS